MVFPSLLEGGQGGGEEEGEAPSDQKLVVERAEDMEIAQFSWYGLFLVNGKVEGNKIAHKKQQNVTADE